MLNFLTNNNNTLEKVTNLNGTYLGMASPYYSGTISDATTFGFGAAGSVNFNSIDPTLLTGSPFLSGSDFSHPRIANFLLPQSITISNTQNLTGGYQNVTITGTGNVTLTGGLNITGTLTVQNGATLNLNTRAITGTGAVNFQAGSNILTASAGGFAGGLTGALKNTGAKTLSADAIYTFNGTTAQATGASFTGARDLTINNSAGVTLSGTALVGGVLRLQTGAFAIGNNLLTINSTATRQGVIDNFGANTGSITGTSMNFRRLTRGNSLRQFASPLSGSNTLGSVVLAGGFTCSNTREFDEPSNIWIPVINPCNSQPMNSMQSFLAFAYGNRTLTFSGLPLTGTQTVSITRSSPTSGPFVALGWNAIGNPYPSSINWSNMAGIAGNTAVSNLSAYIYNSSTNNYGIVTSTGVASGGASNTISPGQGILVRANVIGGGTLTFNNTVRTSGSAQTFIRKAVDTEIRFTLDGVNTSDEVVLLAGKDAVNAEKLFSPDAEAVSLYFSGAEALTIKSLEAGLLPIPMSIKVPAGGKYTITANSLVGLETGVKVLLEDKLMSKFIELSEGTPYTFNSKEGVSNRFVVHFGGAGATGFSDVVESMVFVSGNELKVVLKESVSPTNVVVYDLSGKQVLNKNFEGTTYSSPLNLPSGIYNVVLKNGNVSKNHKVVLGN